VSPIGDTYTEAPSIAGPFSFHRHPPSGSYPGGVLVTVQGAVVVLPMDRRVLLWEHRT